MIGKISVFWQKLLNLGIRTDDEFTESKRIRILNGVAFLASIFTFFNALWGFKLNIPSLSLLNYAVCTVMILVLFINSKGYFKLSKFLFFITLSIHIGTVEMVFDVGAHFYLFPLFIIAAFIITSRAALFFYLILLILIFLVSESRIFPQLFFQIDPSMTPMIKLTDGLLAFVFSILGIDLFRRQYERNREEILEKNKLLKESARVSDERATYASLLLKEMNHRVKNNLQLISSLLNIHAAQLDNKSAKEAVLNAKRRISSIALIHRQLYKDSHSSTVDITEYIDDLIPFIKESLLTKDDGAVINVNAEKFQLSLEDAVSIGLIINETLTNSIRHGFKKRKKNKVSLTVGRNNNNTIQIIVIDSGTGIQKMVSSKNSGFGYELIKMLASNYDGNIIIDDKVNKITIELHYKMYDLFSVKLNTPTNEKESTDS